METNYRDILYERKSVWNGQTTIFRLTAGPGSRNYRGIDNSKDRIIYIMLERDGLKIELPYAVEDQLKIWEYVFDVWQKPEKKIKYANQFFELINRKLIQAKLDGFGKAYWR